MEKFTPLAKFWQNDSSDKSHLFPGTLPCNLPTLSFEAAIWRLYNCHGKDNRVLLHLILQPQNIKIKNKFITLEIKNHHHQLQNVVHNISKIFSGGTGKRQSVERYFVHSCFWKGSNEV